LRYAYPALLKSELCEEADNCTAARSESQQVSLWKIWPDLLFAGFIYADSHAGIYLIHTPASISAKSQPEIWDYQAAEAAVYSPLELGQVRFDHITTRDGLAENRVWDITQDRRGFLWFTSMDGINRYDGYEIKVYKHDPTDSNSPRSTLYRRVLEDSQGMLWFGSVDGGLSRFNPETEQWTNFWNDPRDPGSFGGAAIWAIAEDQNGDLWIGTEANGLFKFAQQTEQFTQYQNDPDNDNSLSADQVLAIEIDRNGIIWVGTQYDGLNRFDLKTDQWTRFQHDPNNPDSLSYDHILSLHEDREGNLWVGTWGGGLDRFTEDKAGKGTFSHYQYDPDDPSSLGNNLIASIYDDQSETLWVATFGGGLNQLIPNSDSFVRYQNDPTDSQSLSHNMVASIYESRDGILWVGTAGGGVNKLDLQPKAFTLYQHQPGEPNSLSSSDVRAILVDRAGGLWIGTYGGGLNYIERQTGSGASTRIKYYQSALDNPNSLNSTNVIALEEDQDGMIWIGTSGEGFSRFDPETETFWQYAPDPESPDFRPAGIRVIYEDRSGTIWFGSWGKGLGRFDRQTETFKAFVHDPGDPTSLSGNAVFSIFEDRDGDLWIGTLSHGLNRFDRETETFTPYTYDQNIPNSLSNDTITTIDQDKNGNLWIGTAGGGLNRFDPQAETFTRFTEKDGFPSNTINAILLGNDGALWISSAGGLSKFNPQTGSVRNYTQSDGLQGNQFTEASAYQSHDGELFFGGPNGLTAFYPEQIKDDEHLPQIALTDISLNHVSVPVGPTSVLVRSIPYTDQLSLSQDDRVISFDFSPLSFRAPEKNYCSYRLEGFDESWIEVGSTLFSATYTNLNPDQYVFRVKCSNSDGIWNEPGISTMIIVPAPWWQTGWFYGLLVFACLAILVGGHRWRVWRLERQANELAYQVAQRTKELEASEQQYRDLVENIGEAIYTSDPQGKITYINPAVEAFTEYSPSEVIGQHFSRFIHPDDLQKIDRFQQIAGGSSLAPMEYRILSKTGHTRWIRVTSMPVFDEKQVVGVRGVLTDITERKQLEEQREQAAAAAERERLARELHDVVSQTLYSIAAIAEALPSVWERDIEVGRQGLNDLGRMAGSALAEMRTLLLELRPATIEKRSMAELLRQLVEAAEGRTKTTITLTLTGECDFPLDVKIALFRIAQEGLNNIIKHAQASQIKIGLYCQLGGATLGISDNGRGMNTQEANAGHFGLSFMRERAEMIGAEFTLETGPDDGTEITVIWKDPKCGVDKSTNA